MASKGKIDFDSYQTLLKTNHDNYLAKLETISIKPDIVRIRNKYKKLQNFDKIIAHAFLYGKITDKDYVTVKVTVISPQKRQSLIPNEDLPIPAIIYFPNVKISEIESIVKFQRGVPLKAISRLSGITSKSPDSISNIERDRNWYWMKKKSGLGYGKLFNPIKDKENITFDGFKKAIQQYTRRLTMET
jgi:hypothetical protein